MPVRKIPKNYRSVTGTFASIKNKRNIFYESLLERDFFLLLEFDKTVSSYEEQPIKLYYDRYGKKTKYTPDCLVYYNNDKLPCIHEVKFSNEIKEKKVFLRQKFEEMDIDEIYLDNIKFIYNYSVIRNETKIKYFKTLFKKFDEISYIDFLNQYSTNRYEQAEAIPYIWYLVLQNFLEIELTKKISKETILKVIHE